MWQFIFGFSKTILVFSKKCFTKKLIVALTRILVNNKRKFKLHMGTINILLLDLHCKEKQLKRKIPEDFGWGWVGYSVTDTTIYKK